MTKTKFLALFSVLALLLTIPAVAFAQSPPAIFVGNVMVDGEMAPDGTTITAEVDGEDVATAMTMDGEYNLTIADGTDWHDGDVHDRRRHGDGGGELDARRPEVGPEPRHRNDAGRRRRNPDAHGNRGAPEHGGSSGRARRAGSSGSPGRSRVRKDLKGDTRVTPELRATKATPELRALRVKPERREPRATDGDCREPSGEAGAQGAAGDRWRGGG